MAKKKQRAPSIAEARVYRQIKKTITSGEFKPGAALVQEELCRQFRASRTPIRDALTHLQAEGLVLAMPNKGVFVRDLSAKDVHDIYEVRLLLESAAAKDAAANRDRKEFQAILDRAVALKARRDFSFDSVKSLGSRLHHCVVVASGNAMMREILDRMDALIEVSRIPFKESTERLEEINHEHVEILQALVRGDGEMAADLMKTHISLTREAHLKILMGSVYGRLGIKA